MSSRNLLRHVAGLDNASGAWYLWWSGLGGRVVFPSALLLGWWKHHECHTPGCRRPGHVYRGSIACRRHRPID